MIRFFSEVHLADGSTTSWVQITKAGRFSDPRYGTFEITDQMLGQMVENFERRVFGQDIYFDIWHDPKQGAAGTITKLAANGGMLRGQVEWTELGIDAIRRRGMRYTSAEYSENWRDNETGTAHGPVLLGAALTTRPVIKGMDPIRLSDGTAPYPVLIDPYLANLLEQTSMNWSERLKTELHGIKLSEANITALLAGLAKLLAALPEANHEAAYNEFLTTGKTLAEAEAKTAAGSGQSPAAPVINLSVAGLNPDQVKALIEADRKALAEAQAKEAGDLEKNRGAFDKHLAEAKGLSDETRKTLAAARDLITAAMTESQIKALADHQISLGNQMEASRQLAALGWRGAGTTHIQVTDNSAKALAEQIDRRLGLTDMPASRRFFGTGGVLQEENKRLAEKALARFDAEHGAQLAHEYKLLAGGETGGVVSDVSVPISYERTVIREALYNLVGMMFVNSDVAMEFAATYSIPYSYRDTTAGVANDLRKYEGQAIINSNITQTAELAYPIPQKLGMIVSDELRYLTSGKFLNWDVITEQTNNATRIVAEATDSGIFNEVLQAADEYGATAVSNEDLELQADDTKRVFVLAQWPVVRPRKVYDLQGNQIGSTVNPITVTYNSVARSEYVAGTTLADGIYYVLDYNLGEIYLVDEAGTIQTPANGTAFTISYSYTTNVAKFSTDLGSATAPVHWDTFLYQFGLRRAVIEDDRYHMCNFGLMAGAVHEQILQAQQFGANYQRAGTNLAADGNLGQIRAVPTYKSVAPGLHMSTKRVILGERGITRLRLAKMWSVGELENEKDFNGRFTGRKHAYGDQFMVLHTPTQLKRAYTSIVLYSATGRVARVNP